MWRTAGIAPPNWVALLVKADAAANGVLIKTLRAVANADMNMQKAARILGKHPNTVYSRIDRIREFTGLDGQRYHDLTELLLGVDCSADIAGRSLVSSDGHARRA